MSSNPTRVDWPATAPDPDSSLQQRARALESISRQRPLSALLAFSGLHQQTRNRRLTTGRLSDREWLEERFVLDEVLQLVCDRIHSITHADGVVVALAEASNAKRATKERPEFVCRAAAGLLAVPRDTPLPGESEFLQDCVETGRTLRCDDCEIDTRVESDFARYVGARSTVLIPLRGQRQTLGVLQVFSRTPWNFAEHDVRCFDLFAELILSALKPEDQDRRFWWLSDVADDVLRPNPAPARPEPSAAIPALELAMPAQPPAIPAVMIPIPSAMSESFEPEGKSPEVDSSEIEPEHESLALAETTPTIAETVLATPRRSLLFFPRRSSSAASSHPGLSVVMGLVAVAALFSAGAWWGMQVHGDFVHRDFRGKTEAASIVAAGRAFSNSATLPPVITTAPAPPANVLSPGTDSLVNTAQPDSDPAPLTAVTEDKLAALPKIMGVRHWSSSVGSTVVIDMEDQVPYEVHRLMSPERIYFDLHDTALARELDGKTLDVDDPSLTRVRVAQPVAGVTRVVLDTKDGSNFSVSMESNPYRLVVELRGNDRTLTTSKSSPNQAANYAANRLDRNSLGRNSLDRTAATPKAAPVAALTAKASDQPLPARTGKFRIVLDAGHGGWDLGTVGRQGLLEKDLVLDVTQRLGKLLQARLGSEVMFTRTNDTYLPLEQRADFANQAQADLFVSVHANYSTSAAARGVETYYTDLFAAPGSRESGSRESGSREAEKHDDGRLAKVTPVSLSLGGLREKIEESRRLASSIQRSLHSALAAQSPTIRDRGIKDSAFVVLTGTTMPSILTEISFVSSPADERNLQSATYRQQIAEALYQGIARYEQSSPHAKVAQLQTSARR